MAKGNNEVKVTFKAFNQDFNKSMKEMNTESTRLRQEMKLQSEQMRYTATDTDKLKATINGLEKQYEIAQQKTKATADALEQARKQWGDNSTEAQKFENQLRRNEIAEQQVSNSILRTNESLEKAVAAEQERTAASSDAAQKLEQLKGSEDELAQSSQRLTAEYELQKAQLGDNATESQKLNAQMDNLNASHELAGEKVKNYEQQLEEAKKQYGESSSEVMGYENQLLEARTAEQQLANEIVITNKTLEDQNDQLLQTTKRLEETGEKMAAVGKNLTKKVTAPLVLAGGAMVKFAADQETSFAQTSTLLEGSEKDLKEYKDSIRDLSSAMGVSFGEVAESVYGALSAGQTQADAVAFTEQAMKLAGGGFTDTSTAVDVLTTALNAYNLESEDATKISDMLITTQDLGKTTVDELGNSMGKVIPIAEGQNVAFDQLSTAYAVLTKNGQETNIAGTNVKAMLAELGKAGSKTDKILREETGQAFSDLMEDGASLTDVLKILKDDAESSGLKLSDMFGSVQAGTAALTLAAEDGAEFDAFLEQMGDSAGATQENFEKMADTLEDKMRIAKESITNAMAEMGETVLPIVTKIAEAVAWLAKMFSNIPGPIQFVIVALGGLVAAIGPVVWAVGTFLKSWGAIQIAFTGFPALATLVTGAMTAIKLALASISLPLTLLVAAVGIAIYAVIHYWDEIKAATIAIFSAIGDFLSEWGVALLIILSGPIGWIVAFIIENWEDVKRWTIEIFTAIGDFFSSIFGAISTFLSTIVKSIVDYVVGKWENLSDETKEKFFKVLSIIVSLWTSIKTFFTNIVSNIWTTVRDSFQSIVNTIREKMENARTVVSEILGKIYDYFMNFSIFRAGVEMIQGFIDGIKSMFATVLRVVGEILGLIPDTIKKVLGIDTGKSAGRDVGDGLSQGMNDSKSKVKKSAKGLAKAGNDEIKKENKKAAKENKADNKKAAAESKKATIKANKEEADAIQKALTDVNAKTSKGKSTPKKDAKIWSGSVDEFDKGSKGRGDTEKKAKAERDKANKQREADIKKQQAASDKQKKEREREQDKANRERIAAEKKRKAERDKLNKEQKVAYDKAEKQQAAERKKANSEKLKAEKKADKEATASKKKRAATTKKQQQAKVKADKTVAATKKKKAADAKKAEQDVINAERKAQADALQSVNAEIAERRANGGLSSAEEAEVWKKSIDTFKEGSKERIKAQNSYAAAQKKADKELEDAVGDRYAAIKQVADDRKSMDQLSLKQEADYWKDAITQFKKGTKERISAQKEYQRTLKQINDNVVSVNKKYADQMKAINDKLVTDIKDANNKYDSEFNSRRDSLVGFAGLFDEFEIKMDKSGEDLLNNLNNQVDGFKTWQKEMEKLEYKNVDDALIEELRQMGPKALPELLALNDLTASELNKYSNLFKEKAELATKQATDELAGLKDATKDSIIDMQDEANKELGGLEQAWVEELKKVTSAAEDELSGMKQIGRDAGNNLLEGLADMQGALVNQAVEIARNVNNALRDTLGLNEVATNLSSISSVTRPQARLPESNAAIYQRMQSTPAALAPVTENVEVNINVDGMTIREEADIKKVARELDVYVQQNRRGRGR